MCEIPQAHRLIVAASCPQYAAFAANSPNVKLLSQSLPQKLSCGGTEPNAAAAASGAHPPVAGAESECDRLIRIGN